MSRAPLQRCRPPRPLKSGALRSDFERPRPDWLAVDEDLNAVVGLRKAAGVLRMDLRRSRAVVIDLLDRLVGHAALIEPLHAARSRSFACRVDRNIDRFVRLEQRGDAGDAAIRV